MNHEKATEIILQHCPEIPHWPQLPKHSKEGILRQFLPGMPGLTELEEKIFIDTENEKFTTWTEIFYEEYFRACKDISALEDSIFRLVPDSAKGFFTLLDKLQQSASDPYALKGQVTGPITTGTTIQDSSGNAIINNANLRDILIKHIAMKAVWQITQFQRVLPKAQPIILIDEPGMTGFGSTGYSRIPSEIATGSVEAVIKTIHDYNGLAGIHICAGGDWRAVLNLSCDIISLDAYSCFDNFIFYQDELTAFLARGGMLAWGIVPTGSLEAMEKENSHSLFALWKEQMNTISSLTTPQGVSKKKLLQQTLITPSCGTGSLSPAQAVKVLTITREVSQQAKNYYSSI